MPFQSDMYLFNKADIIHSHKTLKNLYCHMGFRRCQIYQLIDINIDVPENLLPDGTINSYGESAKKEGR